MRVAAVIPARMQSSRLPGKPLLRIAGVPMILRVLERARACELLHRTIVATDSEEIYRVVTSSGGEAWMTSPKHRTGSDRVAEVASKLPEDLILNIQGDEPCLPLSTIQSLVQFGLGSRDFVAATAKVPILEPTDLTDPNVVKVVTSNAGKALYFSRYPIPCHGAALLDPGLKPLTRRDCRGHYKHIGIYLFRREFLIEFVKLPQTPLECAERLEQLRILEHGFPMQVVEVTEDSISVDTPADLELAEAIILDGR